MSPTCLSPRATYCAALPALGLDTPARSSPLLPARFSATASVLIVAQLFAHPQACCRFTTRTVVSSLLRRVRAHLVMAAAAMRAALQARQVRTVDGRGAAWLSCSSIGDRLWFRTDTSGGEGAGLVSGPLLPPPLLPPPLLPLPLLLALPPPLLPLLPDMRAQALWANLAASWGATLSQSPSLAST